MNKRNLRGGCYQVICETIDGDITVTNSDFAEKQATNNMRFLLESLITSDNEGELRGQNANDIRAIALRKCEYLHYADMTVYEFNATMTMFFNL